MTKAMEILSELNGMDSEKLYKDAGRIKAILTILDVVEHEILEESRKDHEVMSNKYNKLLDLMRRSALKEIYPVADLAVRDKNGLEFYICNVLYNNYIINDMYGILRVLNRDDVVEIVTDGNVDE